MKIQADPNKIEALSERVKRSRKTLESLFTEATRIARNTVGSARSAYPEHRGVQSVSNELERIIAQIRQDASSLDLLLANQAKQLFTIATTYRRQEQEATRMLLRKFSVGTRASIASNEMQKQVAHSTDAWPYDPMYAGNVPILPNQHYQYLLGLAATDSIEGDQAFSQLQDIKVAREELGQAYLSLITHVQEGNASGCWQDIYRILEVAKKLNKYNLFTQPPQPMEPLEPVPKEEPHWWDKMIDGIQDVGEETWAGLQKFGNSIKEIGLDFTHDANDRAEKAWDSPYDFVNYWTFGIPDLVVGTYKGMGERAAKWDDSVYDFSNWLTFGTVEVVDGALFPREPLSKEHLYNVIGLGVLLAPLEGMIVSKGAGKTVGAGEVQILGRKNDVYGNPIDEGMGEVNSIGKIVKDGNKTNYTNPAGNELSWTDQHPKSINNDIDAKLNSTDPGKATEAKVASLVRENKEVTGFGQQVKKADNSIAGDLDVVTKDEIIEVKKSIKAITDVEQFDKYVNPNNGSYFNPQQKKVILYIDKPLTNLHPNDLKKLQEIKSKGVTIVNSLDELKEALK